MNRGSIVKAVFAGDFGKPRPALVIQSDLFANHTSVTVAPFSTSTRDAPLMRIRIEPDEFNGLRQPSDLLVDKVQTVSIGRIGGTIGVLDDQSMIRVNRALAVFLGIA